MQFPEERVDLLVQLLVLLLHGFELPLVLAGNGLVVEVGNLELYTFVVNFDLFLVVFDLVL